MLTYRESKNINKTIVPEYCCITTLRGLELKNNNPTLWNRLQLLMDHDADSKVETEYNDDDVFKVNTAHLKYNLYKEGEGVP